MCSKAGHKRLFLLPRNLGCRCLLACDRASWWMWTLVCDMAARCRTRREQGMKDGFKSFVGDGDTCVPVSLLWNRVQCRHLERDVPEVAPGS